MRRTMLACAALILAGCGGPDGGDAVPTGMRGEAAQRLSLGMTPPEAIAVFGPEAGLERDPVDWEETCLSFAYGAPGATRYVHALFRDGQLRHATDGHAVLCTYPDPPGL